jgi:1,4-dihydroxy-6-naphthoate synthase
MADIMQHNGKKKFTLGYSPCPNDCFIFDALVHQKIDTGDMSFEVVLEDVETLNRKALMGELDITKLSFFAYAQALKDYILLSSGSAMGFNCGPLLVAAKPIAEPHKSIKSVAIPGKMTTANFLLSIALPEITNKQEYLFSDIEEAVLSGQVDAGLIIHENRFTYHEKGLHKIMDLGEYWNTLIQAPIPLGGIAAKRNMDPATIIRMNDLIKKSVEFAFENPESSMAYVKANAQAMREDVMIKHIALYVNHYSVDMGSVGREAVELLFAKGIESGLFADRPEKRIID